jgi:adenosine kinase
MPAVISGSLAFDTISVFHGRFSQQILPDQLHILNVSFLVPTMRREFGGCAGNIAYSLRLLGGVPITVGTLGSDGESYRARLTDWGVETGLVKTVEGAFTAQAMIMTDQDNNQITAFHPGAMSAAHEIEIPARADVRIGIIAPNDPRAMKRHAEDLVRSGTPFIFDPGQLLPAFSGEELLDFSRRATWVACNDYEARVLMDRTGLSLAEFSKLPNLRGVVVTLGGDGCEVWQQGERLAVPGVPATEALDPTGCGDAFRAALLYGLERDWPLARCVGLGNLLGAHKIAHQGTQNHHLNNAIRAFLDAA